MGTVNLLVVVLFIVTLDGVSCVQTSAANSGVHCIESEMNALIRFKQGFKNLSSWRLDENCCNWNGVGCDNRTGHVVSLDLHNKRSEAELSTSLLGLPHLRYLDLSQNNFLGALIPEFISNLKNLEYLNLSNTNFRGTIPQHVGNLTRLQFLDLSGGISLRADNLQWLRHLFSVKVVDLSGVNMISAKTWLHDISLLASLSKLRMSSCQLSTLPKLLPSSLNLTSLQSLDLSLNYFNAPIPSWLFNTSRSLVSLNLTRSGIYGLLPSAFAHMDSLRVLDLSDNSFKGKFPPSFEKMASLIFLDLSTNSLSGNLPPSLPSKLKHLDFSYNYLKGPLARSIAQLRQLVVLKVARNSFSDSITEHFLNFSNLRVLDLSSNSIILNLSDTWMPPFQLDYIGLRSCLSSTEFPRWIQTQKEFSFIDISDSNISDKVSDWFWSLSAKVQHMNLARNSFRGEVPDFTKRESLNELDLSWNNFHGPLPHFSPKLMSLILAGNSFNGTIAPICESLVINNSLRLLDLSSNDLSGQLSDCWRYGENLVVLKLANNHLSGEIPHSIGYLSALMQLLLHNNRLSKNLPSSLKNLQGLKILDVARNSLSGRIPFWLGENLQRLMVLALRQNKFGGNIPMQICQLKNLVFLDLSSNALSGMIPKCVDNFLTMAGIEEPYEADRKEVIMLLREIGYADFTVFQGIDLSANHLSGEIPVEITSLNALENLNISMNHFTGAIPTDIANLQRLEALDLSSNKLSCSIPPSIVQLKSLGVVNFSFNGFTGKIPQGNQFDTFTNDSYLGNQDLCGLPLSRACSGNSHEDSTHCNNKQEVKGIQPEENNSLEESSIYIISIELGLSTGFWAFWVTLMLKKSWRYAYMGFLDNMCSKIYVIAATRMKFTKK